MSPVGPKLYSHASKVETVPDIDFDSKYDTMQHANLARPAAVVG
jgi:hypothetical protein